MRRRDVDSQDTFGLPPEIIKGPENNSIPLDTGSALSVVNEMKLRKLAEQNPKAPQTLTHDTWPYTFEEKLKFIEHVYNWREVTLAKWRRNPSEFETAKRYYKHHRIAFINHWVDTYDPRRASQGLPTYFPMILFEKQRDAVKFFNACMVGEGRGLVEKARGMGITWGACSFATHLWLFWAGISAGFGSRKVDLVDKIGNPDSIFEKMRIIIDRLPDGFKPKGLNPDKHLMYMRLINPENDSTILGEGGDSIGRGGRTSLYFVDEAAHLEHPESVEASLMSNTRTRIDLSSVAGVGTIFHRNRQSGIEWKPGSKIDRVNINVFVMDSSDHPEYSAEWFDEQRESYERRGMGHIFAREYARDYAAAVIGIIIKPKWVQAAIDAHKILKFEESDKWKTYGGLDVGDGGSDPNALAIRRGPVLQYLQKWIADDTGVTARTAVVACRNYCPMDLNYDCIGVGSGIKAAINNLKDDDEVPDELEFTPWNSTARVARPNDRVVPEDPQSPRNRDMYTNFKAQAWWEVRNMFERTYKALNDENFKWVAEELISIPSGIANLDELVKELSQPTAEPGSMGRMLVNKMPNGAMSPNLADAFVQAYFPVPKKKSRLALFAPRMIS